MVASFQRNGGRHTLRLSDRAVPAPGGWVTGGKPTAVRRVAREMRTWTIAAFLAVISLVAAACASDADIGGASDNPVPAPDTLGPSSGATPSDPSVDTATVPQGSSSNEPTSTPPDVDLSAHSVPLDEIYFDTFDGGSVPLSDSTAALRLRLLDVIPPIDRPVYGDVSAGDWLAPDDLVLGYVAGDEAYAYPFKILNYHEIVNDELDGVPVLISYCPLCRSAIVYERRVGGDVLSFGNSSALYESSLVMVDRTTGSYWWQVAGTAIVGPLTDTALEPLPSVVATWKDWVSLHPDTLVLTRDTGFSRPYERDAFASYADVLDSGRFPFPVGEAAKDARLRPSALVVGLVINEVARAYPVEDLSDPINDEVGGDDIVVFPTDGGATVFGAGVDGETLRFERRNGDFIDVETGSVWNASGVAVSGARLGARLTPVPSRTTFWFAFVGAFPDVELYNG
ncbi:MAG: DUF3179 domain-containing protein [Acidimicrobiia bacterium]|nr:MAG: DUF3179 domain-containing protein [Acidimicrobiia bacterium]